MNNIEKEENKANCSASHGNGREWQWVECVEVVKSGCSLVRLWVENHQLNELIYGRMSEWYCDLLSVFILKECNVRPGVMTDTLAMKRTSMYEHRYGMPLPKSSFTFSLTYLTSALACNLGSLSFVSVETSGCKP